MMYHVRTKYNQVAFAALYTLGEQPGRRYVQYGMVFNPFDIEYLLANMNQWLEKHEHVSETANIEKKKK
jgi:hypothetical protein